MAALIKESGLHAILENKDEIDMKDFDYSLGKITASLSEKDRKSYESMMKNLSSSKSRI